MSSFPRRESRSEGGIRISDFGFIGAGRLVGLIEAGLPAVGRKRLGIRNWECRRPGGDPSTRSLRSLAQDGRVGWSIGSAGAGYLQMVRSHRTSSWAFSETRSAGTPRLLGSRYDFSLRSASSAQSTSIFFDSTAYSLFAPIRSAKAATMN